MRTRKKVEKSRRRLDDSERPETRGNLNAKCLRVENVQTNIEENISRGFRKKGFPSRGPQEIHPFEHLYA